VRNVLNGLDTDLFCPDHEVKRSESELLCVGRASDPNKGVRTLIAALALLPPDCRLTLVDNDDRGNSVFKWAREAGVAARLSVTGRIGTADLVGLYRRAALVVVPSRYEGFGLPAVEGMACGTPVVACRAGALPEVMRLTGGGLLVNKDDPSALARGISKLLEKPELRADLGQRARERVVASLSWPRVAAATAEVYAQVLEERRGLPTATTTSERLGASRPMRSSA
jgi:glycosyltransferase involved in cell wall biosynthesis